MHQRRWIKLFSDYDYKIHYHPCKANVVADALSRKERMKPRQARAMSMTIYSSIKARIREAHSEASKAYGNLRTLIMNEAHTTKYSVYPREDKIYYDLRDLYWWLEMKKDIALYVNRKLARLYINKIIARHGVPVSIISDHDSYFTSRLWQSLQKALGMRLDLSTAYHPETDGQSERTIQTLEDMLIACAIDFGGNWDTHLPLVELSYNNNYHSSVKCTPFEAFYERKCQTPIAWAEVGESKLIRPEIIQETTDEIVQIKERLMTARDRQKRYADNRRKPLEFSVGDKVPLKVSP
ncbi:putative reverse transcriptase domain-containing protein [Tanacetum coccineum]